MGGRKTAKSSGLYMRDGKRKEEYNMKWKQERKPFYQNNARIAKLPYGQKRLGWFWLV